MFISPKKLNTFLMLKLPAAWICGVRVKSVTANSCDTAVRYKWINQNPFKSMFWAVQGMAAELSTGVLVMQEIHKSGKKISMLVISNKASFVKKATGKITFTCKDGERIVEAINNTIKTGKGQTCWMQSQGINEANEVVSTFNFEWTVRVKSEELRVKSEKLRVKSLKIHASTNSHIHKSTHPHIHKSNYTSIYFRRNQLETP